MPVSARFHNLRDRVLADVDFVLAEAIRLSPMKSKVSDPDRPQTDLEAVLRVGASVAANMTGGMTQSWRSRIVAGKAELHIHRATYTGPAPAKGDIVTALSRADEPDFEVANIDDRDHTRLVLHLTEA